MPEDHQTSAKEAFKDSILKESYSDITKVLDEFKDTFRNERYSFENNEYKILNIDELHKLLEFIRDFCYSGYKKDNESEIPITE